MSEKVGFIGLGHMGMGMALNILKAGFDLTVNDINAEALHSIQERGASVRLNPARLAENVDYVFLSLPNSAVVEKVVFGENGLVQGAKPDLAIIDLGTTNFNKTIEFSERLKNQAIRFADSPVSGPQAQAHKGSLTVMFGGERTLFDEVHHILDTFGSEIVYAGNIGNGQLLKLVNQLIFDINVAALAEILPMAVKMGLDPENVAQVVTTGTSRSFASEFFVPRILEGNFNDGYPLKEAYKDIVSMVDVGVSKQIPLPLVQAMTSTYQMGLIQGYGDEGKGAMIKTFEKLLNVQFRKRAAS